MKRDPKEIHEREQEAAEMIEGLANIGSGVASLFNSLLTGGLNREEALAIALVYVETMGNSFADRERWKEDES